MQKGSDEKSNIKEDNNNNEEKATASLNDENEQDLSNIEDKVANASDLEYENQITTLNDQVKELEDKLLRQIAESENIRTRAAKSAQDAKKYAISDFVQDLLPVGDNLERALMHLPQEQNDDLKQIVTGIEMTQGEFKSVLEKYGIETIIPKPGDVLDYNLHHAMSRIATKKYQSGTIVELVQTGYKMKDRLIRAAAVIIEE